MVNNDNINIRPVTLKERIKAKTQLDKPSFLEGRKKADYETLLNKTLTLVDFNIGHHSELGDFVTFIIREDDENYYNQGGQVVVETFKKIIDDLEEIRNEGIPFKLSKVKSKNKMTYTKVEFYPET